MKISLFNIKILLYIFFIYHTQPISDNLTLMLKCNYINKLTIILVNICKNNHSFMPNKKCEPICKLKLKF